jgi:hypothetical protein
MMFFKSFNGRPKICFTDVVKCLTVIILTCVQIKFAPVGDTALTLELVSLSCCVTGAFA